MVPAGKRAALFWGVCIPLRLYLSSRGDQPFLRVFAGVIGYRWLSGLENGSESMFGGPVFWADERPMHGLLWASYAATGNSTYLYGDTAFGAANWLTANTQ